MSTDKLTVVSLGWGVQSFALVAMSALGELPAIDMAIHADTGYERSDTYAFAKRWTPWLEERGVKVVTVSHNESLEKSSTLLLPAFTTWEDGSPSGMLPRQCTSHWKVKPVRRRIAEELARRSLTKRPGTVEHWIGITLDEAHRVKGSAVQYVVNKYPFLESMKYPWSRSSVLEWLKAKGLEIPPKSSCVMCPFHSYAVWGEIKTNSHDWQTVEEVDALIRHKRTGYVAYLTKHRLPINEIQFDEAKAAGQLSLW